MKTFVVFFLLLLAAPLFSQTIHGKVVDENDKAISFSEVRFGKTWGEAAKNAPLLCSKDGSFTIKVEKTGMHRLLASGINHEQCSIPLYFDGTEKDVNLKVELKPYDFDKQPKTITIYGNWNNYSPDNADTLVPKQEKTGKTTYSITKIATGDTLCYQLDGIVPIRSVNGTQSDFYIYDGSGDYRSAIRTKKGQKVMITYDPSKDNFTSRDDLPKVSSDNNPFINKMADFGSTEERMLYASYIFPTTPGPITINHPKYQAMLDYIKGVYEAAKKSGDTKMKELAGVSLAYNYRSKFPLGTESTTALLADVPPTSPFWAAGSSGALQMLELTDSTTALKYRKELLNNPERSVRAVILGNDLERAAEAKNDDEVRRLHELLESQYGDIDAIRYILTEYNPKAIILVGNHVPSFEITSIDDGKQVSDKSLMGRYYLIDFWGAGCGPCVMEMPNLHKVYEKYKNKKGFEIVSLSMDGSAADVNKFRKKWKMPWINAVLPGVFNSDIAKRFEVVGIPKPVLIGPDGNIVAIQDDLRGEALNTTLAKLLGDSN
jgi:thiol-disulfide isomerase/thioredoxin